MKTAKTSAMALGSGDTLNLTCVTRGNATTQVEWLKDGQRNNIRANITNTILTILHVKPGDSGNYSCIGKDAAGVVVQSTTVTVFGEHLFLYLFSPI